MSPYKPSAQWRESETYPTYAPRTSSPSSTLSNWSVPLTTGRNYRTSQFSRAKSFHLIQPSSPDSVFPTEAPSDTFDDFNTKQYESISAEDFRRNILIEERRARATDDEKFLSSTTHKFSPVHSLASIPAIAPEEKSSHPYFLQSKSSVDEKLTQEVDDGLFKMLDNSKAENSRLKVELKALESLLESAKFQLASTAIKATDDVTVFEQKKKEEEDVVKKLTEMEEELKMLTFSENLTDQTLNQLKSDNERLRHEKTALLQVIYRLSN